MVKPSSLPTLCVDAASSRSGVALLGATGKLLAAAPADVRDGAVLASSSPFGHALARAAVMGREIALVAATLCAKHPSVVVRRVVIEYPRIYKEGPRSQLPGDDLLVLAASAMAAWVNLSALFPDATIDPVRPQEWKGQVKKEHMLERILSKLTPEELALIPNKKNDNVVDAVGIGLHSCYR